MRYNNTVTFQEATEAADNGGSIVKTWAEVSGLIGVPCIIDDISSSERFRAERDGHFVSQRVYCAYNSLINKDLRVIKGDDLVDGWDLTEWTYPEGETVDATSITGVGASYIAQVGILQIGEKYKLKVTGTCSFATMKLTDAPVGETVIDTFSIGVGPGYVVNETIEFQAISEDLYILFSGGGTATFSVIELWNNNAWQITYLRNPNNLNRLLEIDIYEANNA